MKDITIITANYYPEETSTGLYTTQLAEFLSENGKNVTVITGFPYYPWWKIPNEYQKLPSYYSETINNVKIYRYKFYIPTNQSFFYRILHILSYTFGSVFNLFKVKKSDLIFCNIPFTTCVFLGFFLKWKLNAKLWTSIKDFEFDAAFESGLLKRNKTNLFFKKFLDRIEDLMYKKSDIVSSISYKMVEKIKLKSPKSNPIFFPDWVDSDFINPSNYVQHSYIDSEKFNILYSGNIGQKQDWNIFIEVVKRLKHEEDIHFVLVGDGAQKDNIINIIKNKKLSNISYFPPIPFEDLPNLLCSANLHVLFQKSEVIDSVMPSKILGMMSSGRVSIITGDNSSEVAKHISLSQGIGFYQNEQIDKIIEDILNFKNNPTLSDEIGNKARNYISEKFSKDKILNSFLNILDSKF